MEGGEGRQVSVATKILIVWLWLRNTSILFKIAIGYGSLVEVLLGLYFVGGQWGHHILSLFPPLLGQILIIAWSVSAIPLTFADIVKYD